MGGVDKLLQYVFGAPWQLVVAVTVYGLCASTWKDLWKSDPARKRWTGYLIQNNRYQRIMGGALDWLDARLTPEIADQPATWSRTQARAAWSHTLLNATLLIALIYPLLSLLAVWAATGHAGRIGAITVIPAQPDDMARAWSVFLLTLSSFLYGFGLASKSLWRLALCILATGMLVLCQISLPDGAFSFAFVMAITFLFTFIYSVDRLFAIGLAAGLTTAFTMAFAFAFTEAGRLAFAGAILFGFAFGFALRLLGHLTGRPTLFLLLYACLMLIAILVAVTHGVPFSNRLLDNSSIILFIGIFPLMNALADFASIGLTRFCLRRGLGGRIWFWSVVDLVGGALIFIALVAAMMGVGAWVHWPDGTPLLDLGALLADLRANPRDYWWLYVTFLSTLLPTVLHAGIALFAGIFRMWPWLREYIVTGLDAGGRGDDPMGRWAVRALCLTMTLAIMAPVAVFGWAIQWHGWTGGHVLSGFTWLALTTGMI